MNFFAWGPLRCKIELRKTNVIGNHHFLLCALKDKEKYYPYNHEEKGSGIPIEKMALAYCVTSFISGDETTLFMYSSFLGEIDFFLAS